MLGSCGLTRHRLDSTKTNCISYGFPVAVSTWKSTKYFPSAKIQDARYTYRFSPPQRTSMGPHRKLGIYVGYKSPSIIKYLEPLTGDLYTAQYTDCIFDKDNIPALGGDNMYQIKC